MCFLVVIQPLTRALCTVSCEARLARAGVGTKSVGTVGIPVAFVSPCFTLIDI